MSDTGWTKVTLGNGLSVNGLEPSVRRIGKQVFLRGKVKVGTKWSEHDSFLTIPSGYRPNVQWTFIQHAYGTFRYLLAVNSNGSCVANGLTNDQYGNYEIPIGKGLDLYATLTID